MPLPASCSFISPPSFRGSDPSLHTSGQAFSSFSTSSLALFYCSTEGELHSIQDHQWLSQWCTFFSSPDLAILSIPVPFLTSAEHWAGIFQEPSANDTSTTFMGQLKPCHCVCTYPTWYFSSCFIAWKMDIVRLFCNFPCSSACFWLPGITLHHQSILSPFSSSFMSGLNCACTPRQVTGNHPSLQNLPSSLYHLFPLCKQLFTQKRNFPPTPQCQAVPFVFKKLLGVRWVSSSKETSTLLWHTLFYIYPPV